MIRDLNNLQQEHITHLLKEWHHWSASKTLGGGYPSTAPGCSQYRASRQYDDSNGALDHDADVEQCRAVEAVVQAMTDPWRSAMHMEARNLAVGRSVFRSPRVPHASAQRITQEARLMLWNELERKNLA